MAEESVEFRRLARRAQESAEGRSDELRGVLMTIGATYELLAHVQDTLDRKLAIYRAEQPH
jgi:hypothetical protein